MDFYEICFPQDIAYGATGGPEFFTDIVTSSSGYEQRNINWNNSKFRYNLAPAIKTKEQIEEINETKVEKLIIEDLKQA